MSEPRETLTFRTRALAQAHPLSPAAHRYVNRIVARERIEQPQTEIGIWAGYALTVGYSLRRLEEVEVLGTQREPATDLSFELLDESASRIAAAVRTSGAHEHYLLSETEVVEALDDLINGEIERRLDHWRDSVSQSTWNELEQYIAWWVIKGYALRISETSVTAGGVDAVGAS